MPSFIRKSKFTSIFWTVSAGLFFFSAAPAWAENHALLVGVADYPSLEKNQQLRGPTHDILMMRDVLQNQGFKPERIQILADGVPKAGVPTHKNIIAALDKLAKNAKPGDYIYLHFAGHGSQQPTRRGKIPPEPDGLDEIFLPQDIGKWNGAIGNVDNALVDSEMNQAITRMRSKGSFVWAVFDSCHSGTMTRGAPSDDIRFRNVGPDSLGIPKEALLAAISNAPKTRGEAPSKSGTLGTAQNNKPGHGGFVAFYAAQTTETTPEMGLPFTDEIQHRIQHGLFSHSIAETLEQYKGITYKQLGQQVLNRYAALGMTSPTPLFEGGDTLDAPVFGTEAQAGMRQWPLKIDRTELSISAGNLQQFSEGAIFAVVPSPTSTDKEILAYVRVKKISPLASIVEPIAHADKPAIAMKDLKAGQYVRLVYPNLRFSLSVALPEIWKPESCKPEKCIKESDVQKQARQLIADIRAKPQDAGIHIKWVEPGKPADLRLMLAKDKLWLLPPDGLWVEEGAGKSYSIDLLTNKKDELRKKIAESFNTIAKARNLLKLATTIGPAITAKGLEVKGTVIKRDGGAHIPLDTSILPELRDGDTIKLVFHNKGRAMIDVTALYLDSEYGIKALYPDPGRLNRIEVGAEDSVEIEINADTTGTEQLILIAVEAQPLTMTTDFSFLAQPKLERTREVGKRGGAEQGLVDLFAEAGFGFEGTEGTARGGDAKTPIRNADVRVFNWRVMEK